MSSDTRMELDEWWPQAQGLVIGQRVRGDHACGDPGTLLITRSSDHYSAYCFRCGTRGYKGEQESLTSKLERMQREAEADHGAQASTALPEPRVYDLSAWPRDDALWFYRMGLSPWMIAELGLYWCPSLGRMVLPIMQAGRAVFWQARSHKRKPKWIAPAVPKRGLVAKFGAGTGDTIVLCEDALSAYKVGRVTEAWSLLGTKITPAVTAALLRSGKRVATWLDDDLGRANKKNPGQEAATSIRSTLRAVGLDVRNITSPRDPKYYNAEYIREKLCST